MKKFKITFGTGKEKIVLENSGINLLSMLAEMKVAGWEVENITSIKLITK